MPFRRPYRKSKPKRKSAPRRRFMGRRPRTAMRNAPTGSFASRAETFNFDVQAGNSYDLNDIQLGSQLPVCTALAAYYQYYRITSVQLRLKPNFDTYAAAGGSALPYLYFLYDKSGSLGSLGVTGLQASGAKPVRVDDKTIIRRWKPAVRISGDNASVPMFKTSPWMPTHSTDGTTLNAPPHMGAVWFITKSANGDNQQYNIDVTVTVQYRKPLVTVSPA